MLDNKIMKHMRIKIIQHFKTFKTISLIFVFVIIAFGYAISKNQVSVNEIELKAEAVSEGICLTFNNIPPETKRLFIHFQYLVNEEIPSITNHVSSFSDLREDSLEQVKQTGKVIFPIVKAGCEYKISAICQNENFEDIVDWVYADCIASKGIYLNNNVSLTLNENSSAVTLSSEPIFSSEIAFDDVKYNFGVTIHYQTETGTGSIGVGSHCILGTDYTYNNMYNLCPKIKIILYM